MGSEESKPVVVPYTPPKPQLPTADIGEELRQELEWVKVERRELEMAETALARAKFDSFEPKLVHNKLIGVNKTNQERVAETLITELKLTQIFDSNFEVGGGRTIEDQLRDLVRSTFQLLPITTDPVWHKFSGGTVFKAGIWEAGRRFSSRYGVIGGVENDDGTADIAYAIHLLQFELANDPNLEFTSEELGAIKDTYTEHQALLAFKQENLINEISYV